MSMNDNYTDPYYMHMKIKEREPVNATENYYRIKCNLNWCSGDAVLSSKVFFFNYKIPLSFTVLSVKFPSYEQCSSQSIWAFAH